MLTRFRQAVNNMIGSMQNFPQQLQNRLAGTSSAKQQQTAATDEDSAVDVIQQKKVDKFEYTRPEYLQLNFDEVEVTADHHVRPILVPRDVTKLPWNAGYAEVINGGKTRCNEDQAVACHFKLKGKLMEHINPTQEGVDASSSETEPVDISYTYFGVFDGHAGSGAALMARHMLHLHIQQHLFNIQELLQPQIPEDLNYSSRMESKKKQKWPVSERDIPIDSLITGALESSFYEMDEQITREKSTYQISGGCTALVALFILGKLYVANAGDSRRDRVSLIT